MKSVHFWARRGEELLYSVSELVIRLCFLFDALHRIQLFLVVVLKIHYAKSSENILSFFSTKQIKTNQILMNKFSFI